VGHDVFISYSSKDKPFADAACNILEKRGLRCWMAPRDILPGADWGEAIIDAINGAHAFVLVFSSHANESAQIKREVERAVNRGLPVVPVRIEQVAPAKALEYFISTPHWLDALTPPVENHLNYLADVVDHIVNGKQKPGPATIPGPPVSRRSLLIGVGTVSAVAAGGAGAWALLRPPPGPTVSGKGDAPPPLEGFDTRLSGIWNLMVPTPAGMQEWTLTLADGRYDLKIVTAGQPVPYLESGGFSASGGAFHWTPPAASAFDGSYRVIAADALEITGPLGTATWRRRS